MSCAIPRCRRQSTVGVLPSGARTARFICERHWTKLAAMTGSSCDNIKQMSGGSK